MYIISEWGAKDTGSRLEHKYYMNGYGMLQFLIIIKILGTHILCLANWSIKVAFAKKKY